MNNNAFYKAHPPLNDGRISRKHWFSKHWQSLLGLTLLVSSIFSSHSPIKSHYIDTDQEQTSHDLTSPTLRDSETASPTYDWSVEDIVTGTLFIGVAPDTTLPTIRKTLQADGVRDLTIEKFWPEFNLALVRLPEESSSPVIAASSDAMQQLARYYQALEQIPAIRYVNYNSWVSIPSWTGPDQSTYSEHVRRLSTETIEYIEQEPTSTEEVVIALIDSGYDTTDLDTTTYPLWENQAEIDGIAGVDDDYNGFIDDYNGWDWIDNDNVMNDEFGHGTQIGDTMLDILEQQGIDRRSIKIQPLRILREDGRGEIADLIDALAYGLRKGISIANLSIVSYYNPPALEQAIEIAYLEGLLTISSSYLCGRRVYWPAAYAGAFAVSGIHISEVSGYICQMPNIADIAVQVDTSNVVSASLASLASPHVTAAAALILSKRPDSSNADIKSLILSTASYLEYSPVKIFLLDIEAIIRELDIPSPNLNAPQLDKKLYLPLITN